MVAARDDLDRAVALLAPDGSATVDDHTRKVTIAADRGADQLVEVVGLLGAAGIGVADVALRRPTLDDVFLAITGHVAEETVDDDEAGSS